MTGGRCRRAASQRARIIASAACLAFTAATPSTGRTWSPVQAGHSSRPAFAEQLNSQRRYADVVVSFQFEQTNATTDQIEILFSNVPIGVGADPRQATTARVEQAFSFAGRDYPKGPVSFSRRVPARSFLDSRFLRVVNGGTNPWFPSTITMIADGRRILDRVSMYPRKGQNPRGGIERWGQPNATFWELDLQRFKP